MKRFTALAAASLVLAIGQLAAQAQQTLYWDKNGPTAGFVDSGAFGDGTWDNGTTSIWTTDATGSSATTTWNDAASPADNAIINVAGGSGTNGSGWATEDAGISISAGTRTTNTVTVGDTNVSNPFQWVVLQGAGTVSAPNGLTILNKARLTAAITPNFATPFAGVIDTGTGSLQINAGGQLDINSTLRLNAAGKVVLNGGTIFERNTGNAGTYFPQAKNLEINGTGTIGYDDGNGVPDNQVSILNGNIILGTGGDPSTGGAGTLIKTGPDQVGYAYRANTGGGQSNAAQNSFAKLKVVQGSFRLRNTGAVIDERLFGAVPTATLADAITLDGGGIGSNQTVTLDAKRGITITANGGYFDHGATAGLNIPGPITAAPGAQLEIGDPTSVAVNSVVFELSNANNTATFQGNVFMLRSTLRLDSSLNVAHFSGTGPSTTVFGTVTINDATTLTVGSDGLDASYDGRIANVPTTAVTGGIFTKVGAGTLTLNPAAATTEWSNTGGVNINGGSIKFAAATAGFATVCPVSISATGKLNMNGISDTFGSLAGPAGAIVDMKDTAATAGALTLGATTGSTTYSGTIVGGGDLTKGSSATALATQVLAGNTTLGTVAVNFGTLIDNATMTTSGGVTIGASGELGGTGTVIGAVMNNGVIGPGASVGTLSVTGNVTEATGSILHIELSGATSDKLAVTGNIDLSAAGDFLSVTGAGTGSSWIIGTYTGTETGVFDNITTGYTVTYTGGNITLNAVPVGVPGDYNGNGVVDAADYVVWRTQKGQSGAGLAADGDGNGTVNDLDYDYMRARFGNTSGSGSSLTGGGAVPEPATIGLAIFSLALGLAAGRRR